MKNLRNLFLAAVLFLGINATVQAQDKVAHINFAELIQAMPEYAQAQKSMADLQAKYKADYDKMVQEFQTKGEKYQQEAATAGDATNAARSKEMEEMGMRISQFEQNAAIDMQKKSTDLNNPIMDKAFKAVEKVANAGGYNYVFDSGTGVIIAKGKDLMQDVKKELGIQ
ncbi:MAG TPA: OmpH family outer membrane protein [Flavobacterium sp.]|nr:OmpH family outer membrane protein [Flavobacterium sp.]